MFGLHIDSEKAKTIKKQHEQFVHDLEEIQAEQEELQKKADGYDEMNKPVEIPAYVAQWIEEYRKNHPDIAPDFGLIAHLDDYFALRNGAPDDLNKGYKEYMDGHCIEFIKAWLYGYTVKQEPKWAAKGVTDYFKYDDKIILFSNEKDAQELAVLIGENGETEEFHSYPSAEFISIEELRTGEK